MVHQREEVISRRESLTSPERQRRVTTPVTGALGWSGCYTTMLTSFRGTTMTLRTVLPSSALAHALVGQRRRLQRCLVRFRPAPSGVRRTLPLICTGTSISSAFVSAGSYFGHGS